MPSKSELRSSGVEAVYRRGRLQEARLDLLVDIMIPRAGQVVVLLKDAYPDIGLKAGAVGVVLRVGLDTDGLSYVFLIFNGRQTSINPARFDEYLKVATPSIKEV